MRRLPSSNRVNAVVRHYAPDLARQLRALRLVLRRKPPAHEGTVEERETKTICSNTPAGKPNGEESRL